MFQRHWPRFPNWGTCETHHRGVRRALRDRQHSIRVGSADAIDGTSSAEARRQAIDTSGDPLDAASTSDPRIAILGARADALLAGKTDASTRLQAGALIATTPEITAPADGASISGVVTATAVSTAPQVRFDAAGRQVTVPVVDGAAATQFETRGVAGSQQISAVDCDDIECGTSADSVMVTVANDPVAIDQPTDGSAVGTSVVVVVSAPGGGVRFLLDGDPVGDVAAAPYQATVDTSMLSPGDHTLGAIQCDSIFTSCAGRTAGPVTIRVRNELAPDITSVQPLLFSPNGDDRRDTTTVRYRLETRQDVTWRVLDRSGSTVRGPVHLGDQGAGDHSFVFNGNDRQGDPLRNGGYRIRLVTSKTIGGTEIGGQAEAGMVINTRAPRATDVRAMPNLLYPVRDHYRDTTLIRTRLTADAAWLKAVVEDSSGHTVRVASLRGHDRGRHEFSWNGRKSSGSIVRPGRYLVHFEAQDAAGNRSSSGAARVEVSGKRLQRHSASETVLPKPNHIATIIGSCSMAVTPARKGWKGRSATTATGTSACTRPINSSSPSPATRSRCRGPFGTAPSGCRRSAAAALPASPTRASCSTRTGVVTSLTAAASFVRPPAGTEDRASTVTTS